MEIVVNLFTKALDARIHEREKKRLTKLGTHQPLGSAAPVPKMVYLVFRITPLFSMLCCSSRFSAFYDRCRKKVDEQIFGGSIFTR